MEDMEMPTEQAQEDIHHHARHSSERWVSWVALSSALLAALAAVSVLLAGGKANEAMLERLEASNQWSYYQAKGIKAQTVETRVQMLQSSNKPVDPKDEKKLEEYAKQQKEINAEATKLGDESKHHMRQHEKYAYGVTMFQVAIAVAAISVLTKRPPLWFIGLAFGGAGVVYLVLGTVAK